MAENRISMQDIADELGISKVTVSKALNDKDGVSDELRERIFQVAEREDYKLPGYGQRKARKVGIIMSERFNSRSDAGKFYMGMYESIITELRLASCTGIMITPNITSLDQDLETIENGGLFDGLILLGILDQVIRKKVDMIKLPKVYVEVYDEGHNSDSVITENIYSTYAMTNYLLQNGHTDIGFVGTIGATTSITDRFLGYTRLLFEQGIHTRKDWIIPDRSMDGIPVDLKLPEDMPTAFVCNCDETAFRLLKVLKQNGFTVPEEISVVGFDNDIYARLCDPGLTTVAVNVEEIGKVTVRRILHFMDHSTDKGGVVYRIPGKNVFRDSVVKRK